MKDVVVLIPFSEGEERNVIRIIEIAKKGLKKNNYKIFLAGPNFKIHDKNLTFITEKKRMGKSFWIKKILKQADDIFIVISGDVLPSDNFFTKILEHFDDDDIGMVCPLVVPIKSRGLVSRLSELVWLLCDEISLYEPKGSEAIAFNANLLKKFHSKIVADEAYIEANVKKTQKKIIYDRMIKVRNKPPRFFNEFVSQRIRYFIGHLQVYKETRYKVVSMNYILITKSLLSVMKKTPSYIHLLLILCFIELLSRLYASILFFTGRIPYKWKLVQSSRTEL